MDRTELITPEQWPINCQASLAHKELYQACRKLALYPGALIRFPLNGLDARKAAKKAHWYFRNFCGGHFKLKTGTGDGYMYLRKRA